jgi:hypothetical protein
MSVRVAGPVAHATRWANERGGETLCGVMFVWGPDDVRPFATRRTGTVTTDDCDCMACVAAPEDVGIAIVNDAAIAKLELILDDKESK